MQYAHGRSGVPRPPAERHDARTRAFEHRAVVGDGLRPDAHGHLRGERRRIELRLQGDRRPSRRRARGASRAADTGRFSTTTRCGWRPRGAAPDFIDWNGINFNGRHEIHPKIVGLVESGQPDRTGLGEPANRLVRRPSLAGTRRPSLWPASAIMVSFPGPIPPWRPRCVRLHRGQRRKSSRRRASRPSARLPSSCGRSPSARAIDAMVLQVAHRPALGYSTPVPGVGRQRHGPVRPARRPLDRPRHRRRPT